MSKRGAAMMIATMVAGIGSAAAAHPTVKSARFGTLDDGRAVRIYTLTNKSGASVAIMNLGATIVSLRVPDRAGKLDDVTLGFDQPAPYLTQSPYFGAVVGRYANRIKQGQFSLDGHSYKLAINNGPNALHGGLVGFDKRMWQAKTSVSAKAATVTMTLLSRDGDEGYPGQLAVVVTYSFDDANRLTVSYQAKTTKPTVINLSQHSYFNLNGQASGAITDHELTLNASHYTPVDQNLIPTGEIAPVAGTPMDFRSPKAIGRDIALQDQQLLFGLGYDHNWVLDKSGARGLQLAASVYAPATGRALIIRTDQPGIQFYSGNFLDGKVKGKGGVSYQHRAGFCLETQHYPDSPNQPGFPSTVLRPGTTYRTTTVFEFSAH